MKLRLVLVLIFFIAAICGAVAYAGSRVAPVPGPDIPFLFEVSERKMNRIDLKGIDSKEQPFEWALIRESAKPDGTPGGWVLSAGAVGIDRASTIRFFQALKMLHPAHKIEDGEISDKPEIFGFDHPDLTITLRTNQPGSELYTFNFGKKHQFTGRRYLRVNSDPSVYLVDEQAYLAVKKQRADLELKAPFRFDTSLVDGLEIRSSFGSISLARSGGGWTVASASGARAQADMTIVGDLLAALSNQQAEESIVLDADGVSPKAGDYGLDRPKAVVEIHFAAKAEPNPLELSYGERLSAEAGIKSKQYFVKAGGSQVIFRLKQRPKQDLFQSESYFWPRKPLAGAGAPTGIRLLADGRAALLNNGSEEDRKRFNFMLDRLLNLEVLSYDIPEGSASAAKPMRIEALNSAGEAVFSIEVGAPLESAAAPEASRFPPYLAVIDRQNQPPLKCIISGAEVELFRELFKRMV